MEHEIRQIRINSKNKHRLAASQINKPLNSFKTKSQQLNMDVKQCIQRITLKMQNAKLPTLHPPYFQKTLSKFRNQSFSHKLKKQIQQKLNSKSEQEFKIALQLLNCFIQNFDEQFIDSYIQQIREPYIRKIFNEGYQIDKVNFKKLNSEYQLRKQIEEVLTETSQWLIQIQLLEDILDRIQLYFNIRSQTIMEKLKTEGAQDRKGTWAFYFSSLCKRATSFALRKGSKVVQNTGYASMLTPAFAILTWAIIGGSGTIPWKGGFDAKSLLIPVLAFTVPYMLDGMAESIQRNDFKIMLQNWAQQFEIINKSIRSFNQLLLKEMKFCSKSQNETEYKMHLTNLQKYVQNLSKQVQKVSNYDQQVFEQMRERTKAYFTEYIQIEDGQWTTVMTPEQYQKHKNEGIKKDQTQQGGKQENIM